MVVQGTAAPVAQRVSLSVEIGWTWKKIWPHSPKRSTCFGAPGAVLPRGMVLVPPAARFSDGGGAKCSREGFLCPTRLSSEVLSLLLRGRAGCQRTPTACRLLAREALWQHLKWPPAEPGG